MDIIIETEEQKSALIARLGGVKPPFTVALLEGRHRTLKQNRLQRKWMIEIGRGMGVTPEEARGYCKLVFGVPLLREESEFFKERYDDVLRGLAWPQKLKLMMEPLDLPVTRIMTVKQKTEYLDRVYKHFTIEHGFPLTEPDQ